MEKGHVSNLHSEGEAMTANITFLTGKAIDKQKEKKIIMTEGRNSSVLLPH